MFNWFFDFINKIKVGSEYEEYLNSEVWLRYSDTINIKDDLQEELDRINSVRIPLVLVAFFCFSYQHS
jgi:hypothetical protein